MQSTPSTTQGAPELADVRGQPTARRALEIAAAGRHHLLLLGAPGSGKTMLASRLPGLLPAPTPAECLLIATIASVSGHAATTGAPLRRPFRAPHHTASAAAVIGGGPSPSPGEVTLATGGVLFLDELPEFRRDVLEALRTTMESGRVVIARARGHVEMPASPLVVAAANPCPCGYAGDRKRQCRCAPDRAARYLARMSGPLIDRFDLHVHVRRVGSPRAAARGETTAAVHSRVEQAGARRAARGPGDERLETLLRDTSPGALSLLDSAVERLGLSARSYVKALRVARTIADLSASDSVRDEHVAEAVQYRVLDREDAHPRDDGASPAAPEPAQTTN